MRKLKSKFKKDSLATQRMKAESKHWEKGEFIGAYTFKDYQIFHSFVDGANYCSISRKGGKEVSEDIIKEVAEHFIGRNYEVTPNGSLIGALAHIVNIWEVKLDA